MSSAQQEVETEWEEVHDCRYKQVWRNEYNDSITISKYPAAETVTVTAVIGGRSTVHEVKQNVDEARELVSEIRERKRDPEVQTDASRWNCAECDDSQWEAE